MEPPPGGPIDTEAPQLASISPDTFAVLPDFDDDVEFVFNEVISEGGSPNTGQGTGDLEKLVILSPTTEFPRVRWRRNRITVQPKEGWQRDRVYRVQLLPGVTDLQRNRLNQGALLTFTTGAPRPTRTFQGTVVDWTTARPAPVALVVALQMPDSLPYRGLADSSGRFELGPLPDGEYVIKGVLDENRNNLDDPREAFDSVLVKAGRDSALELWAFVHDTAPPRIRTVTPVDSASATVEFAQMLDPRQRFQPSAVRLSLMPDSSVVKVVSLLPKAVDDSLHGKAPTKPDSGAADTTARDTTRRQPPGAPGARPGPRRPELVALTGRPPLTDQLVLRPAAFFRPGTRYTVEIKGVRNVTGVAGDVVGTLVIPEKPAADTLALPDSLKKPADSLRKPADTTRAKADSVVKPSARPAKPIPAKPVPTKPAPAKPSPVAPSGRKPQPTLPTPAKPTPTTPQ
jgi:hypothetical protein